MLPLETKAFIEREENRKLDKKYWIQDQNYIDWYMRGAREVLRWIKPTEEMPEENELVQVKISVDIGINHENSIEYDYDKVMIDENGDKMFEIEQCVGVTVVGWRYIERK